MSATIRVVLLDDHPLIRQGVRSILADHPDLPIVGEGGTGWEFIELLRTTRPDVALLDLNMPAAPASHGAPSGPPARFRALPAIAAATRHSPQTRILILSQYLELVLIEAAARVGVAGYLLKDDGLTLALPAAIRRVAQGGVFFSPAVAALFQQGRAAPEARRADLLTPRELEIMRQIAQHPSRTYAAQAAALNISEHTLHTHLKHIYERLGVNNLTAAVIALIRCGMLDAWEAAL
jgi:DNA-binding NarL/FixJ family response regulator